MKEETRMNRYRVYLLMAAFLGLVSCHAGKPQPVGLVLNEEACSQCQMAISQREFAAEVVFAGGDAEFFDDIGCMASWVKSHKPEKAGIFVVDGAGGEWLDGSAAYYVRSARFHSPMSYGILAYRTAEDAKAAAEANEGTLLSWRQLSEEDIP
jgi:copper chaperone NosL